MTVKVILDINTVLIAESNVFERVFGAIIVDSAEVPTIEMPSAVIEIAPLLLFST